MAYALAGGLCVGFGACGSAAHRPFGPGRAFERALGGHVRGWRRCLKPPAARAQTHKSSQLHQFLHHSSLAPHTLCTLHLHFRHNSPSTASRPRPRRSNLQPARRVLGLPLRSFHIHTYYTNTMSRASVLLVACAALVVSYARKPGQPNAFLPAVAPVTTSTGGRSSRRASSEPRRSFTNTRLRPVSAESSRRMISSR